MKNDFIEPDKKLKVISWFDLDRDLSLLLESLRQKHNRTRFKFYGIPRGGAILAGILALKYNQEVSDIKDADIIIDDIVDSGRTRDKYVKLYPNKEFCSLYYKDKEDLAWYVFPYEGEDNLKDFDDLIIRIFEHLQLPIRQINYSEFKDKFLIFLKKFFSSKRKDR